MRHYLTKKICKIYHQSNLNILWHDYEYWEFSVNNMTPQANIAQIQQKYLNSYSLYQ